MSDHTAGLCIDQSFVDHVKCARAPLAQDGPPTRPQAVRPVTVRCSQRTKRGLQLAPLALLLLHDQDYKVWCHGGHGTSCSSCANIVLTAHASPRLAAAASTRGCGRLTSHSAGDQKKLSQRLPSVWGRWEAGWDYYHYRFTGISAPRSSTYLSEKFESPEGSTRLPPDRNPPGSDPTCYFTQAFVCFFSVNTPFNIDYSNYFQQ